MQIKLYGARWSANSQNTAGVYAQEAIDCYRRNTGITPLREGAVNPLAPMVDYRLFKTIYLHDDKIVATNTDTDFASSATDADANRRLFFVVSGSLQFMTYDEIPNTYPTPLIAQGHLAGVAAPANAPLWAGSSGSPTDETLYTYTYVTKYGEESAPSFVSNTIKYGDADTSISLAPFINSADPDVVGKRIYQLSSGIWRQVPGSTNVVVDGITIPNINLDNATTTKSVNPNAAGRAVRQSDDYDQAPSGILYLAALDNEVLAIASEHQVLLSVMGQWGAFPLAQRFDVSDPITAIRKIPGGLAVFTTHGVRMYDVGLPSQVRERRVGFPYPATDPRSHTYLDDGSLIYCTTEGIGLIDTGAPRIVTDGWIDREAWSAHVNLENIRFGIYEGMVVVNTITTDGRKGYVINLSTQEIFNWDIVITSDVVNMINFFRDPRNGQLCYVGGASGLNVFNEGDLKAAIYVTGEIRLPGQRDIGAMRVRSTFYPLYGAVIPKVGEELPIYITGEHPQWIPSSGRNEAVQYKLLFSNEIAECVIGEVIEQCE